MEAAKSFIRQISSKQRNLKLKVMDQSWSAILLERFPNFLQNPSIGIPVIVALYVGILGLCLSGALQRQKTQIKRVKEEKKAIFTTLPENKTKGA